ncbi:hypothetical protein QNI19_17625 [Cytophagaceae bacterium DM2B3-1]|uniref:Uncharacterized protein n=1 Tax=Xanthocytophaga flava TaxID=3048013 RepID=A0ABT7CLY0_9BACT|nr:hypothetical protein [Xanthocytophaga flavus]MDJ1494763.1 hypothetical protein [Xanthocytophaga flavus]
MHFTVQTPTQRYVEWKAFIVFYPIHHYSSHRIHFFVPIVGVITNELFPIIPVGDNTNRGKKMLQANDFVKWYNDKNSKAIYNQCHLFIKQVISPDEFVVKYDSIYKINGSIKNYHLKGFQLNEVELKGTKQPFMQLWISSEFTQAHIPLVIKLVYSQKIDDNQIYQLN